MQNVSCFAAAPSQDKLNKNLEWAYIVSKQEMLVNDSPAVTAFLMPWHMIL